MDTTWNPQGNIGALALAPDGKSLAVTVARGASSDIWVKQLPTGPFSRITFGDTVHFRPSWTGDGKSLVYMNDQGSGAGQPSMSRADGTGSARQLLHSAMQFAQAFETRDGRWMVLRRSFAETGAGDIYAVRTGRHHPGAAAHDAGHGDESCGLARRPLAGVRLGRVGPVRGVRAAVPGRGDGAMAGVGQRRNVAGVGPQRARAVLHERPAEMTGIPLKPGAGVRGRASRGYSSQRPVHRGGQRGGLRRVARRPPVRVRAARDGVGGTELVVVQNWFEELKARAGR